MAVQNDQAEAKAKLEAELGEKIEYCVMGKMLVPFGDIRAEDWGLFIFTADKLIFQHYASENIFSSLFGSRKSSSESKTREFRISAADLQGFEAKRPSFWIKLISGAQDEALLLVKGSKPLRCEVLSNLEAFGAAAEKLRVNASAPTP